MKPVTELPIRRYSLRRRHLMETYAYLWRLSLVALIYPAVREKEVRGQRSFLPRGHAKLCQASDDIT